MNNLDPKSEQWISVKDQLPTPGTPVIISNGKYVRAGWCRDISNMRKGSSQFDSSIGVMPDVTYWQPLPKPPEL